MKKTELIKKIAYLESVNDQLLSEIQYLDRLAKELGFEKGLKSLKSAAYEIINEMNEVDEEDDNKSA